MEGFECMKCTPCVCLGTCTRHHTRLHRSPSISHPFLHGKRLVHFGTMAQKCVEDRAVSTCTYFIGPCSSSMGTTCSRQLNGGEGREAGHFKRGSSHQLFSPAQRHMVFSRGFVDPRRFFLEIKKEIIASVFQFCDPLHLL